MKNLFSFLINRCGLFVFGWIIMVSSKALYATDAQNRIVGNLPYSNQWIFDEHQSFLYVGVNLEKLSGNSLKVGGFETIFGSPRFPVFSIDYFTKLFHLTSLEGESFVRQLSIWNRYSLGLGSMAGNLQHQNMPVYTSSENANLMALFARLGIYLGYERFLWIQPYLGIDISPYFYRHSASLSGAESEGRGFLVGPVVGLHLPLFFERRASIYGELRREINLSRNETLFSSSNHWDFGMGLVF